MEGKAERFVQYTYEKSENKLIVLNVQCVDCTLADPESAGAELIDSQNKMLFCLGSLWTKWIPKVDQTSTLKVTKISTGTTGHCI